MGNHVIVSGATGNLGKEVVAKLTALHYTIHINVREGKSSKYAGFSNVSGYPADLTDKDQSEIFVEKAIENAGSVQAGIFLAGGFALGKLADTDDPDIEKMVAMNFLTAFHLVKPLKKHFETQGGGQFIFIGARPALVAEQGVGSFAYTLSKSMLFQMADMINAEGKSRNITASVVVPSIIDTPENRAAMPDADFNKWIPGSDMADSIAFILSETGQKMRQTIIKLYNNA